MCVKRERGNEKGRVRKRKSNGKRKKEKLVSDREEERDRKKYPHLGKSPSVRCKVGDKSL